MAANESEGRGDIETVTEFVYLGSQFKNTGGIEEEVKRRKTLAGSAFQRLYTKIFKRHDIRLKTKLRVYNTFIIPVLIYGAESWAMTKTMGKELDAFESKMIGRILRISYNEHVTTEEIRCRTGQMKVIDVIKKRRMKWAGHNYDEDG